MKNITIIIGIILLIANLLFGITLSIYPTFNICLNCGVIVVTTILLYILQVTKLKDGYYISLYMLFGILGFIEIILGLFTPQNYIDNWYLLIILLIIVFQAIILTITHIISKTVK